MKKSFFVLFFFDVLTRFCIKVVASLSYIFFVEKYF